ncbi:hypothetical protein EDD85DRAFT_1017816 [Armillaria nabsnona]|nr:hypothetical protein EDD85DRAFT_1017816 [Armillaria nabsnona]
MSDDKPSKRVVIRANRVQTEILKAAYTQSQTASGEQLEILFEQTGLHVLLDCSWLLLIRKKHRVKQEDVCSLKAEYQEPALTPYKKTTPKRNKKATPAKPPVIPKLEYPDEDEIQLLSSPLSVSKAFRAYNEPLGSSPSTAASTNHSSMSAPTPVALNASADINQSPWIAPSAEHPYAPYQPQTLSSPWLFDAKENLPPDYMRADYTFNANIPSSVSCTIPYAQAASMRMQEPSFMNQLSFPLHYSYPPTSSFMADTLNPQLTPLKHLSVLANQNYPNDPNVLSACLFDEQLGQNDPFQAAMGLVYMSRLGLNW